MQLLPKFRKSPFARLLFFYAAGICTAHFLKLESTISFLVLSGTIMALLIILVVKVNRHKSFHAGWLTGLLSAIILFMAGLINMDIRNQSAIRIGNKAETQGIYLLQIIDSPEIKDHIVKATARTKVGMCKGIWSEERYKVMLYLEKDSAALMLGPGDLLWVNILINNVPAPGNPGEFDYRGYLAAKDIYKQAYLKSGSWKKSWNCERKSLRLLAYHYQGNLLQTYQKIGLNKTLYSILAALTLGYRNDLEAHTKQAFSQAGVMHVMALSGFNVAIIALTLGYILGVFERSYAGKVFKTMAIILVIWLFAFVTGLSSSVNRAAVMISFVITGNLFSRHINTYNILFASAFILLAFSPALLTDVSFQLSFTAVLGIILYQPILYRLLVLKSLLADRTWKLFTVSCAAQLSTLPLTLFYFHQFPVYFWLTNLYVVPLVSVIICVAGVFLLVSAIHPFALVVGKILTVLMDGLYRAVSFTEMLPYALLENIHISVNQTIILAAMILFLGLFFIQRKSVLLWSSLALLSVFQLQNVAHNNATKNQHILLIGNLKGTSVLNLIYGREGVLLSDSTISIHDNKWQYALSGFWIDRCVTNHIRFLTNFKNARSEIGRLGNSFCEFPWLGENLLIEYSDQRMVFLQDDKFYNYQPGSRLKVDLVIVSGKLKPDLDAVSKSLEMDLLILDSSVRKYQALLWNSACERLAIPCWNVSERGAYLNMFR